MYKNIVCTYKYRTWTSFFFRLSKSTLIYILFPGRPHVPTKKIRKPLLKTNLALQWFKWRLILIKIGPYSQIYLAYNLLCCNGLLDEKINKSDLNIRHLKNQSKSNTQSQQSALILRKFYHVHVLILNSCLTILRFNMF